MKHVELFWIGIASLLTGCGGTAGAHVAEPGASREIPATNVTLAPSRPAGPVPKGQAIEAHRDSLRKAVRAAERRAASLRELDVKAPLDIQFMSRADFVTAILAHFDDDRMRDTLEAASALGALDPNIDLKSVWTALASQGAIVGTFDAQAKRMLVVETAPSQACVLQHEAIHGLQMQHFDLDKLLSGPDATEDSQMAVLMLAEADANSVPCDAALAAREDATDVAESLAAQAEADAEAGASDVPDARPAVPEIPRFAQLEVTAQQNGGPFVAAMLQAGGRTKLDEVWRSPPKSTSQILHPERYSAGQVPEQVPETKPPSGSGWKIHGSTTWGESRLSNILAASDQDPLVASSWLGDRLVFYRKDNGVALAWRIRFADPDGNHSQAKLARRIWADYFAQGRPTTTFNSFVCSDDPRFGPRVVGRLGNDVVLLVGPYEVSGTNRRTLSSCIGAANWGVRVAMQKP